MSLNISKVCRLCLLNEGTMSGIFNDEKKSATADRIMACVSVEVSFVYVLLCGIYSCETQGDECDNVYTHCLGIITDRVRFFN
jgi:hypothetical protein